MDKNKEQKQTPNAASESSRNLSRRGFIKKAVIGGIAVTSVAGLTKMAVSLAEEDAQKKAHLAQINDEIRQERIMKDKKYVTMTKEEKKNMVQMFVDNYKYEA